MKGLSGWLRAKSSWRSVVDAHQAALLVGLVQALDDASRQQGAVNGDRLADVPALRRAVLVVVSEEALHRGTPVAGPVEHVEEHGVGHPEAGGERLGLRGKEPIEGPLVPVDEASRRLGLYYLALFGRVGASASQRPLVLRHVLGRLHDHTSGRVVAGAASPAGHLVELPRAQEPAYTAVVLRQRGEKHRPYRDIDPDPQRVGPAHHLEEPVLAELFHQPPVLREHACVVDADTMAQQARQSVPEPGPEAGTGDRLSDGVALRPCCHAGTCERLGALDGCLLGEMDNVYRCQPAGKQVADRVVHEGAGIAVVERDGPFHGGDDGRRPPRSALEVAHEA